MNKKSGVAATAAAMAAVLLPLVAAADTREELCAPEGVFRNGEVVLFIGDSTDGDTPRETRFLQADG